MVKCHKNSKDNENKKEDTGLGRGCCQEGKEEEKRGGRRKREEREGGRSKVTCMGSWPSIS